MPTMLSNDPVIAGGNIVVSSFCKLSTTQDYTVVQAGSGDKTCGISQVGPRTAPNLDQALFGSTVTNYAAISGESFAMFNLGDKCPLLLGTGGCAAGDLLMPDANGAGVKWTSGNWYGARSFQQGSAGDLVDVEIVFGYSPQP